MKKLFFLFAAIVVSNCVFAQTPIKYHGEVDAGYSLGVGLISIDRVGLHTIQGISVGKYFSTGIGLGAEYVITDGYFDEDESDFTIMAPLYLNAKGYWPISERFSPYISFDAGASFGISDEFTYDGIYLTPAVGVKFGLLKAQIGYNIIRASEEDWTYSIGALQFKVGLMF